MVAIKLRWYLRKHIWFWALIVSMLALHIPLFFIIRWPLSPIGSTPTLTYTMPFAFLDFMMISGALFVAEKLFSNR